MALVTACNCCACHLSKFIQALRHAPEEILALSNELNDIKALLEAFHEVLLDDSSVINTAFKEALARAETFLAKLQSIASKALEKSADGTDHVNRSTWLLRKRKVSKLRKELKSAALKLDMLLNADNAYTHLLLLLSGGDN